MSDEEKCHNHTVTIVFDVTYRITMEGYLEHDGSVTPAGAASLTYCSLTEMIDENEPFQLPKDLFEESPESYCSLGTSLYADITNVTPATVTFARDFDGVVDRQYARFVKK